MPPAIYFSSSSSSSSTNSRVIATASSSISGRRNTITINTLKPTSRRYYYNHTLHHRYHCYHRSRLRVPITTSTQSTTPATASSNTHSASGSCYHHSSHIPSKSSSKSPSSPLYHSGSQSNKLLPQIPTSSTLPLSPTNFPPPTHHHHHQHPLLPAPPYPHRHYATGKPKSTVASKKGSLMETRIQLPLQSLLKLTRKNVNDDDDGGEKSSTAVSIKKTRKPKAEKVEKGTERAVKAKRAKKGSSDEEIVPGGNGSSGSSSFYIDNNGHALTLRDEILSIQSKYPSHILLIQVGSFYEIYECCGYLEEIASLLDLSIAKNPYSTNKDEGNSAGRMSGFPIFALNRYLEKLLANGKTVAIVDQVGKDSVSPGKNFKRAVTRIVTPGTNLHDLNENLKENSFLMVVCDSFSSKESSKDELGIAWADVSTGEFVMSETRVGDLAGDLLRVDPKEILVSRNLGEKVLKVLKEHGERFPYCYVTYRDQSPWFDKGRCVERFKGFMRKVDPLNYGIVSGELELGDGGSTLGLGSLSVRKRKRGRGYGDATQVAVGALLMYVNDNFQGLDPYFYLQENGRGEEDDEEMGDGRSLVMHVDAGTLSSLEVFKTMRGGERRGSLLADLDCCKTSAGSRLLAGRLRSPSTSPSAINSNLDLIDAFQANPNLLHTTRSLLTSMKDPERCLQRMHLKNGRPVDIDNVIKSLGVMRNLSEEIYKCLELEHGKDGHQKVERSGGGGGGERARKVLLKFAEKMGTCGDAILEYYGGVLNGSNNGGGDGEGGEEGNGSGVVSKVVKPGTVAGGFSDALDQVRERGGGLDAQEADLALKLSRKYGTDVKLKNDVKDGPVLEITISKTSADVIKAIESDPDVTTMPRQKLVTKRRYKHKKYTELFEQIRLTEIHQLEIEAFILQQACDKICEHARELISASRAVAEIDVASSMAHLAKTRRFVRPVICDKPTLDIKAGRHPVVEQMQLEREQSFVANNANLGGDTGNQIWVITGANMGGKSTFLRQCALITLMAQAGLYVPATQAHLSVFDQIFSRVGASDNLAANQSTFMVEMSETAHILNRATSKSLIIMDEIGRGTSTQDGVALAFGILERIINVNKSIALFATHYHELPVLVDAAVHVGGGGGGKLERGGFKDVEFMRTRVYATEGVSESSYGVNVARLAGVPSDVIVTATKMSNFLTEAMSGYQGNLKKYFASGEVKVDTKGEKKNGMMAWFGR
ncbi:hypothetical protein HDU76_000453 [Blyttiomyces sp. JEL0837]|nr:hypothetical protein HDU76_000453 [Blyttiomyces sp. JEL0837]